MERIKPITTEKEAFEYQEGSIIIAYFGMLFRLSEIRKKARKHWSEFFPTNKKLSIEILREDIKPAASEKFEFGGRVNSSIFWNLRSSDYQKSDPVNRSENFPLAYCFTSFELSIATSIERITTVRNGKRCV